MTLSCTIIMLSDQLKTNLKSINTTDNNSVNILKEINLELKRRLQINSPFQVMEYIKLAGASGSLIEALENKSLLFESKIEAAKCLHFLTYIEPDLHTNPTKQKDNKILPSEVITSIQKVCIHILQLFSKGPNVSDAQYSHLIVACFSMLFNLVICSPEEVLGSSIIKASYSYIFSDVQGIKKLEEFVENTTSFPTQFLDQETEKPRAYTNRNRRKRLRRKKVQPSGFSSTNGLEGNGSLSISARVSLPKQIPPSPKEMSDVGLSLKPQWLQGLKLPTNSPNSTNKLNHSSNFASETKEDEKNLTFFGEVDIESRSTWSFSSGTTDRHSQSNINSDLELFSHDFESQSSVDVKVRQYALSTINAVITKVDPQNKFIFWPQMMCQNPSLMTCILNDPSSTVRMTALQVVNSFLVDSQQVLTMATEDKSSTSYTALGKQLGSSIRELHRCLIRALLSEKNSSSLVRILKALELLVENVRYSNLKPGLLTKTVTHVKYFLRYKDSVVRANAFAFMVSVLKIKPQFPELKDLLTRYQYPVANSVTDLNAVRPPSPCEEQIPGEQYEVEEYFESQIENLSLLSDYSISSDSGSDVEGGKPITMVSWIVQRCMDSLILKKNETVPGIYIQVQLQSLKVLNALVCEHLDIIKNSLPLIQHIITVCSEMNSLHDQNFYNFSQDYNARSLPAIDTEENTILISPDPDIAIEHSFLLLGSLLGSVKSELEKKQKFDADPEINATPQLALQLWLWAFQHPLRPLIELCKTRNQVEGMSPSEKYPGIQYPIRPLAAAANVLSHLCSHVLESVGEPILNDILNTVHHLLHHKETLLQLSGIRIMAIIVTYTPVQDHIYGPKLVSSVIKMTTLSLEQKHSNVNKDRLLASWALANVISAIAVYKDSPDKKGYEKLVDKETMLTTLKSACNGCKDKDKIRPHAVRCAGNAIALLTNSLMSDQEIQSEVNNAVDLLIECSRTGNNMKMRWNACQSLGTVLASQSLGIDRAHWRIPVFKCLCSLVECFKNYKVRIQACSALCCPKFRSTYGQEYYLVWKSILLGFEDSQNISDYQKMQHREDLANQLCITLCHLICLLELEDLDGLSDILLRSQDTVKYLLTRSHKNLPPERVSCILKAVQKLKELIASDTLTIFQEQSLGLLEEMFSDVG